MRAAAIIVLSVALCACGGKGDDKGKDKDMGQAEAVPDPAPPEQAEPKERPRPEPYEGELTYARMESAKAKVKPGDDWMQAFDLAQAEAGKPTEIDGVNHNWYLLDGDKCHELSMQTDGPKVGSVSLGTYDKVMKAKYDKCLPKGADAPTPPQPKLMGPGKTGVKGGGEGASDEGGR